MANPIPFPENLATLAAVDGIAKLTDPVVRNYHITQSYHELSQVVSKRLGYCANWCTFAAWASKQAGQTIRGEDLAKALEEHLAADPSISQSLYDIAEGAVLKGSRMHKQGISKLVWETIDPKASMSRASLAVARGNQKVYTEIARVFARFVEECLGDTAYNNENIACFCGSLLQGDPPNGQQYLRQAFSHYYQALFEPDDARKKAELVLLANIECGFHEQTRLQPEIAAAMEASIVDAKQFKEDLIRSLFPTQNWLGYTGLLFTRIFNRPTPLDIAIGKFTTVARQRIRLFLSAHLMELGFPKGVHLHLGRDLVARFPAHLEKLANPDLIAMLKKIDPTPDSLTETGAVDWANLDDRLHFIGDLFRCYQETLDLLGPPFEN